MKFIVNEKIKLISLPHQSTIRETMQAIDRGGIGIALLVEPETERFVGLITDGDIRRALLDGIGLKSPILPLLKSPNITAKVDTPIDQLTASFNEKVRAIPLLNDNREVVDLAIFDSRIRLPVAEPLLGESELSYVTECVVTGWVSSIGKYVTLFEEMFKDFCATKYAIATSSGTTALHLALLALDVGPGDEVIVPTLTFIATANAVTYTGAKPIFIDSDPETWNINVNLIEQAITRNTKAIIPVHLYGHPSEMDTILEIASKYDIAVIEDAAEAHGALYKGHRVGGIGDIGIFSFYGNKIITTGEGGMVTTNRKDIAEKIRILRDHGMSQQRRYWHSVIGYNYRLTNIQAAIGVAQMEKIETILRTKRNIAATYYDALKNIPGIIFPPNASWAYNVYWLYSILIDESIFGYTRDQLINYLTEQDIDTRPFFPPVHTQPIYNTNSFLPIAESLSAKGLSLPSAINLRFSDIERISHTIKSLYESK